MSKNKHDNIAERIAKKLRTEFFRHLGNVKRKTCSRRFRDFSDRLNFLKEKNHIRSNNYCLNDFKIVDDLLS